MSSTVVLIDLIGAVALLLWGLGLLKTGINRAFGAQLRAYMSACTRNRVMALGAGVVVTLALQSSTAAALMVSSFAGQGFINLAMAQAVMLGANIGTSAVTQVLALDIGWLAPAAIIAGVASSRFRKSAKATGVRDVLVGLGLMLLSLTLMRDATDPMRESEALLAFFRLLTEAPVIALALSAGLAAISASSMAVVLFVMALAGTGGIDPALCLLMVAGANLGGAIPPVFVASDEGAAAKQVAVANLIVRGIGSIAMLAAVNWIAPLVADYDPARLAVDTHIVFNVVLALVALPLVGVLAKAVEWLVPAGSVSTANAPKHLDESALSDPPAALAAATRETLRIGDTVEKMLQATLASVKANDAAGAQSIYQLDDKVDRLHEAVKLYLSRIPASSLDEATAHQLSSIIDYTVNLEHVGDIIERSLARMTIKKIENHLSFSAAGLHEIEELFLDTIDNLQLAQGVFMSRDRDMARRLMEGKVAIRHKERHSSRQHLRRLQLGVTETLQTTGLHLDILRDLKRINAHLASVAHPILDDAGALSESRLKASI